ncbi:MAG: hypothetical protein EB060_08700 [Proteobacteria bacterium]|nr:hypothetical protein [Pseudomonadota bacterium]
MFDQILGPTGPLNFIKLSGRPHAPCRQITDISRPGVNGSAFRNDGARGDEYELVGLINASSPFQVTAIEDVLRNWTGSLCTVNVASTVYYYQVLKYVRMNTLRRAERTIGGPVPTGQWVAEFTLRFQYGGPV